MSEKKKSIMKAVKAIVAIIFCILLELVLPTAAQPNLQIHFIDVGQADSILITLNDSAMLIDAGNNSDGEKVVEYLQNLNISKLDYLIGTHPHEDHIGGLDNVIDNFDIDTVLMPKVQANTSTFESVLDSLLEKNLQVTTPHIGDTYRLSNAEFTILSVRNENQEKANWVSIVIKLTYGNQSYLFCGDAEITNEKDMLSSGLELSSDVIKLGHHGSDTSSSEEFIQSVNPEIAIISVGEGNTYNHPSDSTLNLMRKYNISIFRTDFNGTIILTSDGNTNQITCERN